jgi:hypothetical protein
MSTVTDHDLLSWADGQLPPEEQQRIGALVAKDPELRARAEPYLKTRIILEEAFAASAHERVPDRLVQLIVSQAPVASEGPFTFAMHASRLAHVVKGLFTIELMRPAALTAAGLAALAGAILLLRPAPSEADLIQSTAEGQFAVGVLHAALESAHSVPVNAALPARTAASVANPVLTFESKDRTYCREYRARDHESLAFAGVACRLVDGTWAIKHHERIAGAARPGPDGGYGPAGSDDMPSLDAVVGALQASDVLLPEDEARLIANRWPEKPDQTGTRTGNE